MFLAVKLLLYLLFGYHGNSYSYDLYEKWAQVRKHNFKFLAFKTEWKYYFWIEKYQLKCVFDHFSPNYTNKGGICIPNLTTGDLTMKDIDLFQRSNVTA